MKQYILDDWTSPSRKSSHNDIPSIPKLGSVKQARVYWLSNTAHRLKKYGPGLKQHLSDSRRLHCCWTILSDEDNVLPLGSQEH